MLTEWTGFRGGPAFLADMTGPFFLFFFLALGSCSFRGKKPAIALVLPCAWGFFVALQVLHSRFMNIIILLWWITLCLSHLSAAPQGALLRLCPDRLLLVAGARLHTVRSTLHVHQR